jgi:hypothetical protein
VGTGKHEQSDLKRCNEITVAELIRHLQKLPCEMAVFWYSDAGDDSNDFYLSIREANIPSPTNEQLEAIVKGRSIEPAGTNVPLIQKMAHELLERREQEEQATSTQLSPWSGEGVKRATSLRGQAPSSSSSDQPPETLLKAGQGETKRESSG